TAPFVTADRRRPRSRHCLQMAGSAVNLLAGVQATRFLGWRLCPLAAGPNVMPLPKPIGRQKEVLYLPARGHVAVLGTAGSGKTTLAILRAAYLAEDTTDHGGPTLLLTFNVALVTYLRHLMDRRPRNVTVGPY